MSGAVGTAIGALLGWFAGIAFGLWTAKHGFMINVGNWSGDKTFMAWKVKLRCPKCQEVFDAQAEWHKGDPFPRYVAECPKCHYVVLESEWDEVT